MDIKVLNKTQQDVRRYEKREDLASEMSEKRPAPRLKRERIKKRDVKM